jgi:predicted nucleotidyltransferase
MSLFEELIEYTKNDEKIVKSFQAKDSLCQDIFDDMRMKSEIRKQLLKISDDFVESLGIDFFIHDIVLTGSLANFNWSQYSDVDVHIIIDYEETDFNLDLLKEFFDAKKNVWNNNRDVKIKNFDVELYVQDLNESHISSGVYSILNDNWLVTPTKKNPKIDDRKILEKSEDFAKKIDLLVSKSKKHDVLNEIDILRKKIKKFRQSGLDSGGEYSYENLTFKLLRRNGYIEKILDLKSKLTDKNLSLPQ